MEHRPLASPASRPTLGPIGPETVGGDSTAAHPSEWGATESPPRKNVLHWGLQLLRQALTLGNIKAFWFDLQKSPNEGAPAFAQPLSIQLEALHFCT